MWLSVFEFISLELSLRGSEFESLERLLLRSRCFVVTFYLMEELFGVDAFYCGFSRRPLDFVRTLTSYF